MPRGPAQRKREPKTTRTDGTAGASTPRISRATKEALRPWIDLDVVGLEGLESFVLSLLTLAHVSGVGSPYASEPEGSRLRTLARALADCAGDRAQAHFQAALYFRENQVLVRRVKALEAMLRTRGTAQGPSPTDPEADAAARRYLPHGGSG